jgi:hypothetical protein
VKKDIVWVYLHAGLKKPPRAPNPGAEAMLGWARANPKTFFRLFFKLVEKGVIAEVESEEDEEEQESHTDLAEFLRQM